MKAIQAFRKKKIQTFRRQRNVQKSNANSSSVYLIGLRGKHVQLSLKAGKATRLLEHSFITVLKRPQEL
jgi:hypothetical protein